MFILMPAMTVLQNRWRKFWISEKPICRKNSKDQVEKCTKLLHHLLHHLPVNLRRYMNNYVKSQQKTKMKESAKKPEISRFAGL